MHHSVRRTAFAAAFSGLLALAGVSGASDAADTLRREVAKPLNDAQNLYRAHNYRGALGKIDQAEAVSNRTPYETLMVEEMKGATASAAGEFGVAAQAYEALLSSGEVTGANAQQFSAALAGIYFQQKNYPAAIRAAQRYQKGGGADPQMRELLLQSYFLSGDCTSVVSVLQASSGTAAVAGHPPAESQLQMLGSCAQKVKNDRAYRNALLALVAYYPKASYQEDLFSAIRTAPGYLPSLDLDMYRLRRATGTLATVDGYMEMTQLSLVAGMPAEAKQVIDHGFASGVLGHDAQAEREKRLLALVQRRLHGQNDSAPSPVDPVDAAFNQVFAGQPQQGIVAMNAAIPTDTAHPDVAQLHLGEAYYYAGQKEHAVQVFRAVKGSDGSADLARLWALIAAK